MEPGGLEAELSGHFGHCDRFTLVDIQDGRVSAVETAVNVPHVQGGCMGPVNLIHSLGAQALIAGGMGMRPLMGFQSVGIDVYFNQGATSVGEAVQAMIEGRLPRFGQQHTCGGGGHDHDHVGGCGS
jgi:predicted Fe-Mo cluster-binding NifX family protein